MWLHKRFSHSLLFQCKQLRANWTTTTTFTHNWSLITLNNDGMSKIPTWFTLIFQLTYYILRTFGLVYTIWADKFWGILDMRPMSMFSINQTLFLQKTSLDKPELQLFIWDLDFNLGCTPWLLGCTYVAAASFIRDFFYPKEETMVSSLG